jgi:hypothetical protein
MQLPFAKPELPEADQWINSPPLSIGSLHGKPALVQFWSYSDAPSLRAVAFLNGIWEKYSPLGLAVAGIHVPEFEFEKDAKNVAEAVGDAKIAYPVALDNTRRSWNSFACKRVPSAYLFDSRGAVRFTHSGEGGYDETEKQVRELLAQSGGDVSRIPLSFAREPEHAQEITPTAYAGPPRSPVTASGKVCMPNGVCGYIDPGIRERGRVYLSGLWEEKPGHAETASDSGSGVAIRFYAREANIVLDPGPQPSAAKVTVGNRHAQKGEAGADVNPDTAELLLRAPRMYRIYSSQSYGERDVRLEFAGKGIRFYAFSFG